MSKRIVHILFTVTVIVFGISLTACNTPSAQHMATVKIVDLSAENLPAVAAEFITSRIGDEHGNTNEEHESPAADVEWRMWRGNHQIITERPQMGVGELWQLDGQSIIHRKLYHADQRAIEFQQDDLKMLQVAPSWHKLSLMVDQQLLQQLTVEQIEWTDDGYPTQEYQGSVDGTDWRVVMRMDLALPMLIERRHGDFSERTELVKAYPLSQAPWQPTSADGYEIIDYADLGDKESDPFVIKVQAQMGHEHHH